MALPPWCGHDAVALLPINALLAAFALLPPSCCGSRSANQAETSVRGASAMVAELPTVLKGTPPRPSDVPGRRPHPQYLRCGRGDPGPRRPQLPGDPHPGPGRHPPRGSLVEAYSGDSGIGRILVRTRFPLRWTGVACPAGNPRRRPGVAGAGASHRPAGSRSCCRGPAGAWRPVVVGRRRPSSLVNLVSSLASAPGQRGSSQTDRSRGQGIGRDRASGRGRPRLCCGVRQRKRITGGPESAASPAGRVTRSSISGRSARPQHGRETRWR